MLTTRLRKNRRRGVTVVESALVLGVFLLLLFGMFEYCRFLMVLHVTNNAAREGARYAAVNLDKPSDFDYNDYNEPGTGGTTYPSIQSYTTARMGNIHVRNIEGYRVACFAVDANGLSQTPPVVQPKSKTGSAPYPDPYNNTDGNRVPWNTAVFTEKVAVVVDGTYRPILPTFLMMPQTIKVTTYAVTGSEG